MKPGVWPLAAALLSGALAASSARAEQAGSGAWPAAATEGWNAEGAPAPADAGALPRAEPFVAGTGWDEIGAPELEEPPEARLWMVGVRYRTLFVPGWLLNAFLDFPATADDQLSGPFLVNHAAGVELTTRKGAFSLTGAVWWAGFWTAQAGRPYEPRAFLAMEEADPTDPEYIESTISLLLLTADFVFSTMFTDWFGVTYGAGLGIGVNLGGEVIRTEAAEQNGEYVACAGPHVPDAYYCGATGYYGTADSHVWPVYPWVNLLLGLRFKPLSYLEIDVDAGLGIGFFLGLRVNYLI